MRLPDGKNGRRFGLAARKVATAALLGALALLFTAAEFMLPVSAVVPVPGFRLGLANIVVLFAVRRLSFPLAAAVTAVKVCAAALFAGTPVGFFFSACGSLLAFLGMSLLSRTCGCHITEIGISVAGAVLHNAGQLCVAALLLGPAVLSYSPLLCFAAALSGVITGVTARVVLLKIKFSDKSVG